MSKICSHTGFQPLKEVWLGDTYPSHFYNHCDSETQDIFGKITELTNTDLNLLEKKLNEFEITVRRPVFDRIEDYLDEHDNLIKPPITPRDWAITIGDTLYITPQNYSGFEPFSSSIDDYRKNGQKVNVLDRSIPDPMAWLTFPSIVRVGKDLFIDYPPASNNNGIDYCETAISNFVENYRVHVTNTGDHSDAVFCPIKAGYIFSTLYKTMYENTFPGWDVYFLYDTVKGRGNGMNGQWWLPGFDYPHVNDLVQKVAKDWLGFSRETVFEVNMLVIDEKNIICIAEDDNACRKMESLGITPHVIDFKTRGFWDGGIHCLTLDIHREGECLNYWPNRGPNGIYRY